LDALIAFITAAIISFWGSLQLGLVNVAVIESALTRDNKHAFMLALGGVIPEIPYTLLAIYGANYIGQMKEHQDTLGIGVGAVLLALGLYYLIRNPKPTQMHLNDNKTAKRGYFAKGLVLASLNPQLIFFWSGILILLETGSLSFGSRDKLINFDAAGLISPKLTFALGAAVGALLILCIFIYLSGRFKNKMSSQITRKLNKIVGLFFICLGLFSILRNVI
jgi:threonine/homoserine/homoserine lactone efflux protein